MINGNKFCIFKEKLEELIKNELTIIGISIHYGCSTGTVRHFLKKYGLKTICSNPEIFSKRMSERAYSKDKVTYLSLFQDRFPWVKMQVDYDSGLSCKDLCKKYKVHMEAIFKAKKLGLFRTRSIKEGCILSGKKNIGKKHSIESKAKMSQSRKKYLQSIGENAWQNKSDAHESYPCKRIKGKLLELNVGFEEEYMPLFHLKRYYRLDISWPEKKIGFEINGGQHYDTNGDLKEYYQIRHDLIQKEGWILYEIKYKDAMNLDYIIPFILDKIK